MCGLQQNEFHGLIPHNVILTVFYIGTKLINERWIQNVYSTEIFSPSHGLGKDKVAVVGGA